MTDDAAPRGSAVEVFWRFLLLGCMSFGGPAAHIGYFRDQFVARLHWLDDVRYGQLVALAHFLPGPGSSQVGFAIGHRRAGLAGGCAAFVGFTLPSFVLLVGLALLSQRLGTPPWLAHLLHGLKLLAVVVVADAVRAMAASFCSSRARWALAAGSACLLLVASGLASQLLVLAAGALIGAGWLRAEARPAAGPGRLRWLPLLLFAALLLASPWGAALGPAGGWFADFYRSGSLVFGGGHVVLPLLQSTVGDALATDRFLFGYAAAQAIPGPMFSLAGFLGAELAPATPLLAALVATLAIFLPGFLLLLGLQSAWQGLAARPRLAGAMAGINAAVVGLLLAALYQPVFVSAVTSPLAMALAIAGFALLQLWRPPILLLVLGFALAGLGLGPLL